MRLLVVRSFIWKDSNRSVGSAKLNVFMPQVRYFPKELISQNRSSPAVRRDSVSSFQISFIGMDMEGPKEIRPARTATQLHIRLQTRFRDAVGLPVLPDGTVMNSTGMYPVLPLTRSSSRDVNYIGTLKRPAPVQYAGSRPTSPKRPKHND